MRGICFGLIILILLPLAGCVRRTMIINSDPTGAVVYMNGEEIGRTPIERDFTWYGRYDVQVRKEGYETVKKTTSVIAPWWQWVPIDLFAEALPLTDVRHMHYTLHRASTRPTDPNIMLDRSKELQDELESSEFTRKPKPPGPATKRSSTSTSPATTQAANTQAAPTVQPTQ